ncbi:hypothetical protein EEL33_04845 [Muribaculaceae bacterium Isolate-037 (Harlan)]|jgi:hypothetical protein|nr:hypothetical protein EEL33_04845 [Muribaculaceae bacterium Isolate-037 (Harlan)]
MGGMILKSIIPSTRRADVTFSVDGRIDISSHVVTALDIQPGDVLDVLAASDGSLFAGVRIPAESVVGNHRMACYPTKRGSRNYRTHCAEMAREILLRTFQPVRARFAAGESQMIDGRVLVALIPILQ